MAPGLAIVHADRYFPNLVVGDKDQCPWPFLRREIPHNLCVDRRFPAVGFLSHDEAHLLHNTALAFQGKRAHLRGHPISGIPDEQLGLFRRG